MPPSWTPTLSRCCSKAIHGRRPIGPTSHAANWLQWPGFDKLWANIFRDLLPHAPQSETTADFDWASEELVVDYRLSRNVAEPATPPDIFVIGPSDFHAPMKVGKVAAGHYRGRLRIGKNQGLVRVRPLADSRAFPEAGFYRQEDQMQEYGNNSQLLRQIAASTGGRFGVRGRDVFDAGGRSVPTTMELRPTPLSCTYLRSLIW